MLIEKNIYVAISFEVINYLIFMYLLYISLRNYKFKYIFARKKFENEYNKLNIIDSKAYKRRCKIKFKQNGFIYSYDTVFDVAAALYEMYCYKVKKPDETFILYILFDNLNNNEGFSKSLRQIASYFSFDEFKDLILKTDLFNENIKNVLISDLNKEIFKINSLKKKNSKEAIIAMKTFDSRYNERIIKYTNEINRLFEKDVIKRFVMIHKYDGLPDDYAKLYFSSDCLKRIYIVYNKDLLDYTIYEEYLMFEDEKIVVSKAYWLPTNSDFGLYQTLELAINDNINLFKDFCEEIPSR